MRLAWEDDCFLIFIYQTYNVQRQSFLTTATIFVDSHKFNAPEIHGPVGVCANSSVYKFDPLYSQHYQKKFSFMCVKVVGILVVLMFRTKNSLNKKMRSKRETRYRN